VSPKRGDRVAPPPGPDEWEIRFGDNDAAKGWEELCRQAPGNTLAAWMTVCRNPAPAVRSTRHHRLRDDLAARAVEGSVLDHWQIEVTGAGRIWYLVDHEAETIWVDYAGPGHPGATG
jgi:hypothetical protein